MAASLLGYGPPEAGRGMDSTIELTYECPSKLNMDVYIGRFTTLYQITRFRMAE